MRSIFWPALPAIVLILTGCRGATEDPDVREPLYLVDPVTAKDAPLYKRGKLSWAALAAVFTDPDGEGTNPRHRFRQDVFDLQGRRVKMRGYMIPLEIREKHKRFLLSPDPQGCPYCSPGGPALALEVEAAEPMYHSFTAVVVEGVFHIDPDASDDLVYKLTEVKRLN